MKIVSFTNQSRNDFVKLKDDKWLANQRIAGKVVSQSLTLLENLVKEKTTKSLIDMNSVVEEFIIKNECIPTFKNYKGFPSGVCISVNKQLVHGIPGDYKLQDGDVISFDLGATYNGAIADSAITCIYGEPKSEDHVALLETTREALYAGINAVKIGNRIGAIGNAIYKYTRSKGFKVIENYGGHGICMTDDGIGIPHAQPFICNRANENDGIRIQSGLTIAIEPMVVPNNSSIHTKISNDGWTVYTEEVGCHFEHTIFVGDSGVEMITRRENEDRISR
jgi:methionyl aminopeptidase